MTKCTECLEVFKWDDDVINVDDRYYHKECVQLFPSEYVAYVNDDYIGVVEQDDMACCVLDDDDYLEGEE